MAGYAYPVGANTTEYPAHTVQTMSVPLDIIFDNFETTGIGFILGSSANPIIKKTKVNSIYLNNVYGAYLPVQLLRGSTSNMTEYEIIHNTRVLKTKFMSFPVVTGDTRSDDITATETMMNEIILDPGDYLAVVCPREDSVVASANISIGVK